MGSSGSILIGGDMGGLTDRENRNRNTGSSQMNAESGSTTEFSIQLITRNQPQYLGAGGSNAL